MKLFDYKNIFLPYLIFKKTLKNVMSIFIIFIILSRRILELLLHCPIWITYSIINY